MFEHVKDLSISLMYQWIMSKFLKSGKSNI